MPGCEGKGCVGAGREGRGVLGECNGAERVALTRRHMNPDSEWKELTCGGPFPNMPAGKLSVFRNRQGEVTLDRPAEGVCSATVERDPEAFAKQYWRAARLQELRQSGVVAPVGPRRSPVANSRPSEASPRLVDDYLAELEPEPEPELELELEEEQHGRVVYMRGKMHRLGRSLWVGGIPDRLLAGGVVACEKALHSLFSRFGTVEKVTVREKYTESSSTRRVGMQSWAMVGYSSACHDAVDLAVAAEVTLSDAKLEVKELLAKERLSGRDLSDEGSLPEKWVEFKTNPGNNATPLGLETSRAFCCFRKATTSGKWSCECGGESTRKQTPLGGVTRRELKAAFLLFDIDGNGGIDADELSSTMRALATAGRMRAPSDAQIEKMMAEADEDGARTATVLSECFFWDVVDRLASYLLTSSWSPFVSQATERSTSKSSVTSSPTAICTLQPVRAASSRSISSQRTITLGSRDLKTRMQIARRRAANGWQQEMRS